MGPSDLAFGPRALHTDHMFDFRATLTDVLGEDIVAMEPLGGGDVADSFRVVLVDGRTVFAKTKTGAPEGFFSTEAAGLHWLHDADTLPVPAVVAVGDDPPLLVLEWIDEGSAQASTDAEFGRGLAGLHRAGAHTFGREDRRTTGSRGLPNEPCSTWAEFYATQRLLPLARLAFEGAALAERTIADIEGVAARLDDLGGPPEAPARLHGDLWAGNRLVDDIGDSWLIDPAAHGGHREFDLAMMRLFGGFGGACFDAYQEVSPLADGWEQRVPLHQLAPLIVHAIKFGGGYVGGTERAVAAVLDRPA